MQHAKPKVFRDPVHDTIALDTDTAAGRTLLALVDAREVQRLRHVRQLGLSHLVYHGAEHSRFAHSLGTAWLAGRMLDQVGRWTEVTPRVRLVTLAAALLHDIGHGPFSHAFEAATGAKHEERSVGLILHPQTEVNAVLRAVDDALPAEVAGRLRGDDGAPPFAREIVSSQLDADRMDYLRRDGHATGVRIGSFDFARILEMLDVVDGHLAVHQGAQEAVEGYLLARFHMYKQVYLHKAVRAAERVLEAALRRACSLGRDGRSGAYPGGALGALLDGAPVEPPDFARIDDIDIWAWLKRWETSPDRVLADLAGALVRRCLWKTIELPDGERGDELVDAARSVARVHGYDPEHHVLVDAARDSPYRPYTGLGLTAGSIRLVDRAGHASFIEDRSEVVQMLSRLVHRQRLVCFHPGLRPAFERLGAHG